MTLAWGECFAWAFQGERRTGSPFQVTVFESRSDSSAVAADILLSQVTDVEILRRILAAARIGCSFLRRTVLAGCRSWARRSRLAGFGRSTAAAVGWVRSCNLAGRIAGRIRRLGTAVVEHHCRIWDLFVQPFVVDFAAGRIRRCGR